MTVSSTTSVARSVLGPVNPDERAEAVVGVHAEGEGAGLRDVERDPDVEADVERRTVRADLSPIGNAQHCQHRARTVPNTKNA